MKCQNSYGKTKKNMSLSSAEFAQRVIKFKKKSADI